MDIQSEHVDWMGRSCVVTQHMWHILGWGLVFGILFFIVDKLYKHADVILRVACKTCTTAFLTACLWALIYIQNNAEDLREKVRTQL